MTVLKGQTVPFTKIRHNIFPNMQKIWLNIFLQVVFKSVLWLIVWCFTQLSTNVQLYPSGGYLFPGFLTSTRQLLACNQQLPHIKRSNQCMKCKVAVRLNTFILGKKCKIFNLIWSKEWENVELQYVDKVWVCKMFVLQTASYFMPLAYVITCIHEE